MKKSLSDILRSAIQRSGLTQEALAKRAGIAQPTLCKFLRGDRSIKIETYEKLVNALRFTRKGK